MKNQENLNNKQNQERNLIDRLEEIKEIEDKKITLQKLIEKLGSNSFHLLVIFFVLPSALPLPAVPGITQLLALVVFTLIFQLLISKKTLWLPKKFLSKEISGSLVKKISGKLVGLHRKYGIFIKKRITLLFHYPFITIIYLFCCVLAFCVALPIPFSNTIPSIGLLIICFSIIEKDGLFMILGILIGLTGITLATYIYIFGIEALKAIFG